jgi:hypothetical protein
VAFPPRPSLWSSLEGPALAAERRPVLQQWINSMIFLNNTLVASGHFELAEIISAWLQPQSVAEQRKSVLVTAQAEEDMDEGGGGGDGQLLPEGVRQATNAKDCSVRRFLSVRNRLTLHLVKTGGYAHAHYFGNI